MSALLQRVRNAGLPVAGRLLPRPPGGDPTRILILQPDHLGDILLSQPAVRLLRERLPEHELIAVVGPWSAEITRMSWPMDRIVTLEYPGFTRSTPGSSWSPYIQLRREAARLRSLEAATAIVLRPDAWWAACLARTSVSGTVTGYDYPLLHPFITRAATSDSNHRTVQAVATVALALGGTNDSSTSWDMSPSVSVPRSGVEQARQLREQFAIGAPYLVFHPGAGARVKLWPPARWRALTAAVTDAQVVLTGTSDESSLCAAIAAGQQRAVNLAGETDLGGLAAMLRGAMAVVGTDNGAMHLAGAVGAPTVRLFGPSDPATYGPLPQSARQRVVSAGWRCPRCGDLGPGRKAGCGCMLAISVEQVRNAIHDLLRSSDAA